MKKVLVICLLISATAFLFATDFTYTGFLKTRAAMFNTIPPTDENKTVHYIDSKLSLEMTFATSEALKAVWKVQV
ncbi:MAG TPA: hypothetical protein PKK33_07120, partial [Candidatus Cloacimonadota bacterium]|nr:hypothetical protein [Candidatus Cloacimonadota bacterium]